MALIFNSVKEYPDMIKIIIYREPMRIGERTSLKNRSKKASNKPSERSVYRTRAVLEDLCICNAFTLFCTFTFDPKRYNSKHLIFCRKYMNTWIHNCKKRHSKHLQYLVVPELHKSGAIHFHALLKFYDGGLKDSGVKQHGRTVFNIPHWHFGFSTAVKIDNQEAVSRYIRKYITKDMLLLPGKKRYFCSQDLIRPVRHHNLMLDWLRSVKIDKCEFSADQDCEYYTINKSDVPSSVVKTTT